MLAQKSRTAIWVGAVVVVLAVMIGALVIYGGGNGSGGY